MNYIGLKQHFSKYDGIVWSLDRTEFGKVDFISFNKRSDSDTFYRFAEAYPNLYLRQQMMISAFIMDSKSYIRDIMCMGDELHEFHKMRMSFLTNLTKNILRELARLREYMLNYSNNLISLLKLTDSSQIPIIVSKAEVIGIGLETLALLDVFFNYTAQTSISPLWDSDRIKIHKYAMLIDFSIEKFKPEIDNLLTIT